MTEAIIVALVTGLATVLVAVIGVIPRINRTHRANMEQHTGIKGQLREVQGDVDEIKEDFKTHVVTEARTQHELIRAVGRIEGQLKGNQP